MRKVICGHVKSTQEQSSWNNDLIVESDVPSGPLICTSECLIICLSMNAANRGIMYQERLSVLFL
jgi:hypothetical protein